MKTRKKVVVIFMICLIIIGIPFINSSAYDVVDHSDISRIISQSTIPLEYTNIVKSRIPKVHGNCRTSYLNILDNGFFQSVVYKDKLYIEVFDTQMNLYESKAINLELPKWGGYYFGKNYNYIVCGQNRDYTKDAGGEVYRIIKYDKSFNRIASISLNSAETYTSVPFDAGNVSIAENGDTLIVYTSRLRLDGHQSNIAIRVNTKSMTIVNRYGMVSNPDIHASHSFRQIVKYDSNRDVYVYVDLSDGVPKRSVFLQAGYIKTPVIDVYGEEGDNKTGAEVSGVEVSDTNYMVVGQYLYMGEENIFISCVNKDTGNVDRQWLTSSTPFFGENNYYPQIVKINSKKYVVMWGNHFYGTASVKYMIVNENGEPISGIKELTNTNITDCEPIYSNGKIMWIVFENGKKYINYISDFDCIGSLELNNSIVLPENIWDGTIDISWYRDDITKFYLTTPQQLAGLASLVNKGNKFEGKTVKLMKDIFLNDFSYEHEWIPIASCDYNTYFEGEFDGNKHAIYNMYISDESLSGSLFGNIGKNGIVTSVDIVQGYINTGGCIANTNEGIVSYCRNYSMVGSDECIVGGICNSNYNLIYGCKNYGTVWGCLVGGIVGNNADKLSVVSQCSNNGVIDGSGNTCGISVINYGWIYNCYNVGTLTDTYDGLNYAKCMNGIANNNLGGGISNCYVAANMLYTKYMWMGANSFCREDYDNRVTDCYVLDNVCNSIGDDTSSIFSNLNINSSEFVGKLNKQRYSVFSVWMKDEYGINNGFPITYADYSYYTGECKIQPELWSSGSVYDKKVEVNIGEKEWMMFADVYYAETEPSISVSDSSVAEIQKTEKSWWKVILNSPGTTTINIHFDETEKISSADYSFTLVVNGRMIEDANVELDSNFYYYTGNAIIPRIIVKDGTNELLEDTDYILKYKNNTEVGIASVEIIGKGNYYGLVSRKYIIGKAINKITAKSSYTKTASSKVQNFLIEAKAIGGNLTYISNNKSVIVSDRGKVAIAKNFVGKATVTITAGDLNYKTVTKTVSITVKPAATRLIGAKNLSSRKATIKWSKISYVSGYQIQYGIKSSFQGVKTITVNGGSKVSKALTGLTNGKTYYVRIRTYKTVGGNKLYSAWSSKKSVKISR